VPRSLAAEADLFLPEGSLQMIDTLTCDPKTLVEFMFFSLGELHGSESVAVKLIEVHVADVDTLDTRLKVLELFDLLSRMRSCSAFKRLSRSFCSSASRWFSASCNCARMRSAFSSSFCFSLQSI
jgi:hypothetical protein